MKPLKEQFVDWVAKQPRDREYPYMLPGCCGFATFLKEVGICEVPRVTEQTWRDGLFSKDRRLMPAGLDDALVEMPWTFGALHDRLTALAVAEVSHD